MDACVLYLEPFLITAIYLSSIALSGIHCHITTVSKVPMKVGDSISIPCLYEQKYSDNVKYLCKGNVWILCKIVIATNQQPCSGRFCISDDTKQGIFTVTITNLTDEDKFFWCAVKILLPDVHQYFELSVTTDLTGIPSTTCQTSFLLTSTETHAAPAANVTVNGTGSGSPQDEHQRSVL
uniref:Immunoglobulin subtype domain-containing protein n=1 Tax=Amphiprion ocellaris TaxID=80972 RepID=A0A3Q1AI13_AMPOC